MTYRGFLRFWLVTAIACQLLPAQTTGRDDDESVPTAEVRLAPAVRGDLAITIYTWEMPDVDLAALRRTYFPCSWQSEHEGASTLRGTCKSYLQSDGTSAHGMLRRLPLLVIGLRGSGAVNIHLMLNLHGTSLAQVPSGWKLQKVYSRTSGPRQTTSYEFWNLPRGPFPLPFEIRIGTPWQWSRITIPLSSALFAPILLALWLRHRAERKGNVEAASVWVHWLLTGAWLYWISAVSVTDLAAFATKVGYNSTIVTFLAGTALFAGVPMIAVAACIAILMRTPEEKSGPSADTAGLVWRSVAREATLMIPFGMFLVGSGMVEQDWHVGMVSLPAAFLTYRLLSWWTARSVFGGMELLTRGELMETASVIARRAGVTLGGFYILGNRSPREANAFAAGGRIMALTRGLVEHLTRRELLAVIGHEIGHLRKRHVGARIFAFWGYIIVVGPLAANLMERAHLPHWLLTLPLLPLAYIFGTAWFSRKNEFTADAQAVELVMDAEGMIAGLARLRKLSFSPVDWGGIQGSILSHPSMRERVMSIARRFNVAEERALAIMENPDVLYVDTPQDQLRYTLPAECAGADFVFTSSWRHAYLLWSTWAGYLLLAAIVVGAGNVALNGAIVFHWPHVALLLAACVPVCARVYLAALGVLDRINMHRLRRRLRGRLAPPDGTIFTGLIPGDAVGQVGGFPLWDAGFVTLGAEGLFYRGERISFSVPRSEVTNISIEKGPIAWDRDYAARIACSQGCFCLNRPDRGTARWEARRLHRILTRWWNGDSALAHIPDSTPFPLDRVLFVSRLDYLGGWTAIRTFGLRAVMLIVGFILTMQFNWVERLPAMAFIPFMAPLAYLVAWFPLFLRRKPALHVAPVQVETAPPVVLIGQPIEDAKQPQATAETAAAREP